MRRVTARGCTWPGERARAGVRWHSSSSPLPRDRPQTPAHASTQRPPPQPPHETERTALKKRGKSPPTVLYCLQQVIAQHRPGGLEHRPHRRQRRRRAAEHADGLAALAREQEHVGPAGRAAAGARRAGVGGGRGGGAGGGGRGAGDEGARVALGGERAPRGSELALAPLALLGARLLVAAALELLCARRAWGGGGKVVSWDRGFEGIPCRAMTWGRRRAALLRHAVPAAVSPWPADPPTSSQPPFPAAPPTRVGGLVVCGPRRHHLGTIVVQRPPGGGRG
jgi:hypothetical protein